MRTLSMDYKMMTIISWVVLSLIILGLLYIIFRLKKSYNVAKSRVRTEYLSQDPIAILSGLMTDEIRNILLNRFGSIEANRLFMNGKITLDSTSSYTPTNDELIDAARDISVTIVGRLSPTFKEQLNSIIAEDAISSYVFTKVYNTLEEIYINK